MRETGIHTFITIFMVILAFVALTWAAFNSDNQVRRDAIYILNTVSNPPASIEMTWDDISCEEQLRISEIKYQTVAAEVYSLRKTIEAKRNLRPDTLYILNTISNQLTLRGIINGE